LPVLLTGSSEDSLSQISHYTIGTASTGAVPVGSFLGYVCSCLHLTFPFGFDFFTDELQKDYLLHVSTLSGWAFALSVRLLFSFAFRHDGIRFLQLPYPARELGLPCGFLTRCGCIQTLSGLFRSAWIEMRCGLGSFLYSGARCPHIHVIKHDCQLPTLPYKSLPTVRRHEA